MAILRKTDFFLTFNDKIQITSNLGLIQGVFFSTDFEFTLDPELQIYRPIVRNDVEIKDGVLVYNVPRQGKYSYNLQDYTIGLAINGIEVWDGRVNNVTTTNGLQLIFQNSIISVVGAGITSEGAGYVSISEDLSSIGIIDNVEIIVKKSGTYTPWIYYGNIPERQLIAKEQFGRNASGMGGVPESLTPSQAMGYKYYVDFSDSAFSPDFIIPFPSAFLIATLDGAASVSDRFFMGDILDGNGKVALRSLVNFKLFSISLLIDFLGRSAPAFSVINTGSFRTLNYKPLDYQKKTYSPKKIIKDTRFYICLEEFSGYNSIYKNIAQSFSILLSNNVDMFTCSFCFYSYSGTSYTVLGENLNTAESIYSAINRASDSSAELTKGFVSTLNQKIEEKITTDKNIDIELGYNNKYAKLFIGSLDFDDTFSSLLNTVAPSGCLIVLDPEADKSAAEKFFGKNYSSILAYNSSVLYGFQFLETLALSSGISISESDLYQEHNYFNAPAIIDNCNFMIEENENLGIQDYDRDGKITYIDRVCELYKGYSPLLEDAQEGLFSSRGVEMRFWKKYCPIGQLFSFFGLVKKVEDMRDGNKLLTVEIYMENPDYDPEDEENSQNKIKYIKTPEGDKNKIYVLYERGALSNSTKIDSETFAKFKGRLFHPLYLKGKDGSGIQIQVGLNTLDKNEISSIYRLLPSTSEDILNNAEEWGSPIVIVRTNVVGGVAPTEADGIGPLNTFPSDSEEDTFYKISQIGERTEDCIYFITAQSDEINSKKIEFTSIGQQISFQVPEGKNSFKTIQFDIETTGKTDFDGHFGYEIFYQTESNSETFTLGKFYSAAAFLSGENKNTVFIDLELPLDFVLDESKFFTNSSSDFKGKIFDVRFPYKRMKLDEKNIKHFFTWRPNEYSIDLLLNDKKISYFLSSVPENEIFNIKDVISRLENDNIDAFISPSNGKVILRKELNTSSDVLKMTMRNKTSDQGPLKIGTSLGIRLIKLPLVGIEQEGQGYPKISKILINDAQTISIERVDFNIYNPYTNVNQDHFIAPTEGFVCFGGSRNWDIDIDDRNSTAGGATGLRVTGNLISPIWFFDAFEFDLSKKLVSEASQKNLVAIDRVYSNMIGGDAQPYLEIFSIGYTPPPPEIIPRITSTYDNIMEKYTIYYNVGNSNIEMKYSYLGFKDTGTDNNEDLEQRNRTQRKELVVYSGEEREEILPFVITEDDKKIRSAEFPTKSSIKPDDVLVGLLIKGNISGNEMFQNTSIFELRALIDGKYVPFGFEQYNGTRSGILLGCTSDSGRKVGLEQLPLLEGIDRMKAIPFEFADFDSTFESINGCFVPKIIEANSPTVYLSPYGTNILLFSKRENGVDLITAIMSRELGFRWVRPATLAGDYGAYEPVTILTGFVNPLVIQSRKDNLINLFLYKNQDQSIQLLTIPYSAFEKFPIGLTEDEEEYNESLPEENIEGFGELIRSPEALSWKQLMSEGRTMFPIVFEATQDYSAVMTKEGTIYLVSASTSGELRILFNTSGGSDEFQELKWISIPIDILHEDGFLAKEISTSDIYSIALSASPSGGDVEMFISTNDFKLILYRLPTTISNVSGSSLSEEDLKELQDELNQVVPILVVGNDLQERVSLYNKGSIQEEFEKQLPSIQWFPNGEIYVIFYKKGRIKGIKSTSNGESWREVKEI